MNNVVSDRVSDLIRLPFIFTIHIQMTNKLETLQQTHDPSLCANVADLTSRLQDLERKSREDNKHVLEKSTMAMFEALCDLETNEVVLKFMNSFYLVRQFD